MEAEFFQVTSYMYHFHLAGQFLAYVFTCLAYYLTLNVSSRQDM